MIACPVSTATEKSSIIIYQNVSLISRSLSLRAHNVKSVEGEVNNVGSVDLGNKEWWRCGGVRRSDQNPKILNE